MAAAMVSAIKYCNIMSSLSVMQYIAVSGGKWSLPKPRFHFSDSVHVQCISNNPIELLLFVYIPLNFSLLMKSFKIISPYSTVVYSFCFLTPYVFFVDLFFSEKLALLSGVL